ncbi:MAG: adenosylhomocysteinase, partial [Candidatus Thermoplasmatota archaeon]|nr:adenosylhomocysteinase [Candidatus Thermoplasmatota archaeon]
MDKTDKYTVADISQAEAGALRVDWARARMPVLAALKEEALKSKPLAGMKVAGCLHVTKETAVLIETIAAAGAEISWSGCNPLSTQDDVAAWLAAEGYSIHAWHGQSVEDFYWCIDRTLEFNPTLT